MKVRSAAAIFIACAVAGCATESPTPPVYFPPAPAPAFQSSGTVPGPYGVPAQQVRTIPVRLDQQPSYHPQAVYQPQPVYQAPRYGCAENGSCYGDISAATGLPKTIAVGGYYRKNGTYVRGHYRSKR